MVWKCFLLFSTFWFVLANISQAEVKIGFRQLGSTTPVAIQRGTKKVLNIRSNFTLDGAHSLFFDQPGIKSQFLETKPIAAPRRGRGRAGTPFRFEFDVPASQPLGVYECRVATKTAVSSITHILVTDFPTVEESKKNNNSLTNGQSVKTPVAICGTCERSEDVDFYRFEGKAGTQLTFNLYAQRVTESVHSMQSGGGSYLMDAIITLYLPNGQVLAQNNNFYGGDPFLSVKLPETGTYAIEVRDSRYKGNTKYVYCLEISDRPFAHAVFPMAVQRGTETSARLIGYNLGKNNTTSISASASEPLNWKKRPFKSDNGQTNPLHYYVSQHPQLVVADNHLSRESAKPISLPTGINGQFSADGQKHYFTFEAEKDAYYLFQLESNSRQLPLDGIIEIFDAKGRSLTKVDDGLHTKDPRVYFKAPADGQYTLSVYDLLFRGGERFFYHLRAEPSGPDFEIHGEYYYAQLAPETQMIWFARVVRLNGFTGPVKIQIDGLPAGVSQTPVTIPEGMDQVAVILSAESQAKINASLVQLYGSATVPDSQGKMHEIRRTGHIVCELQGQGGGQGRWPVKTQIVGVTEPLDLLKVSATPTAIELKPGEKKELTVKIERNTGFNDPVSLATEFRYFRSVLGAQLPPGVSMGKGSTTRLSGKTIEGKIILEADKDPKKLVAVDKLPIAILARVSITFSITTNYASNPIYLTVKPGKQ